MDYGLFKQLIIFYMKNNNIWDASFVFKINNNIRGQSKSVFIIKGNQKVYIAKYFNYTEDIKIELSINDWDKINNLNDYIAFLDENYSVNIDEISDGLYLKKRCFVRYVIASNETNNVFPNIYCNIEEINFDNSIGGFLIEDAINGVTLEEYINDLTKIDKLDRFNECIVFLTIISNKMYEYFSKGFVHRDLSPDNIMILEKEGKKEYVIIDPGVVKIISRNSTKGQISFCKWNYSSPEQFIGNGSSVNFTSDIYILGIVIYKYITGINLIEEYSYSNNLPHKEINLHLNRTVEDLFYKGIEESPKVDRMFLIIKKMLQYNKNDRFTSPESFISVIETLNMKGDNFND